MRGGKCWTNEKVTACRRSILVHELQCIDWQIPTLKSMNDTVTVVAS